MLKKHITEETHGHIYGQGSAEEAKVHTMLSERVKQLNAMWDKQPDASFSTYTLKLKV